MIFDIFYRNVNLILLNLIISPLNDQKNSLYMIVIYDILQNLREKIFSLFRKGTSLEKPLEEVHMRNYIENALKIVRQHAHIPE